MGRQKKTQKKSKDKDQKEQMNVAGRQKAFNLTYYRSKSVALNT